MLTVLLPSSSAPIMRSFCSCSRMTSAARVLPCCASRSMRGSETPVSAVSAPEKNADSSRQTKTAPPDK